MLVVYLVQWDDPSVIQLASPTSSGHGASCASAIGLDESRIVSANAPKISAWHSWVARVAECAAPVSNLLLHSIPCIETFDSHTSAIAPGETGSCCSARYVARGAAARGN